jgi:hypothetical protein
LVRCFGEDRTNSAACRRRSSQASSVGAVARR